MFGLTLFSTNNTKWRQPKSKFVPFWDTTEKKNYKTAARARKICEVGGTVVVNEWIAQWKFQGLTNEDRKIIDSPRSGRLPVLCIENNSRALHDNRSTSTMRLLEELGPSKDMSHDYPEVAYKLSVCISWVNAIRSTSCDLTPASQ